MVRPRVAAGSRTRYRIHTLIPCSHSVILGCGGSRNVMEAVSRESSLDITLTVVISYRNYRVYIHPQIQVSCPGVNSRVHIRVDHN